MSVATYGFVFMSAALAGPLLAFASARPVPGEIALVIVPPWADAIEIIGRSDGWMIGPEATALGVLALSDNEDFERSLKSHGAWFVLDGTAVAEICGVGK